MISQLAMRSLILLVAMLRFNAGLPADNPRPVVAATERTIRRPTATQPYAIETDRQMRRRLVRPQLRGDFPEYRPGGRAAGVETFWR